MPYLMSKFLNPIFKYLDFTWGCNSDISIGNIVGKCHRPTRKRQNGHCQYKVNELFFHTYSIPPQKRKNALPMWEECVWLKCILRAERENAGTPISLIQSGRYRKAACTVDRRRPVSGIKL